MFAIERNALRAINRSHLNEQLFVATERNAKLRYEGYKKLSEM